MAFMTTLTTEARSKELACIDLTVHTLTQRSPSPPPHTHTHTQTHTHTGSDHNSSTVMVVSVIEGTVRCTRTDNFLPLFSLTQKLAHRGLSPFPVILTGTYLLLRPFVVVAVGFLLLLLLFVCLFFSQSWIMGDIFDESIPACASGVFCGFFFKWGSARTHQFYFLRQDQSTVAQRVKTTVDKHSLTS